MGSQLSVRTWPDIDGTKPVLLVPLGSCEQHGPHLPFDTDTRIAVAVADAAADQTDAEVLVAPAVAFGASGEHQAFPGTLSIGTEALTHVVIELVRSAAATTDRIVLVNGHGGNVEGVRRAVTQLRDEGHGVSSWSPAVRGGDAHAGATETSILLHLSPEVVRFDLAEAGATESLAELMPTLVASGVRSVAPNGILGDPTSASADEGSQLFASLVDQLVTHIEAGP